ncbi:MAG: hypothetical protein IPN33_06475 [Saprospiraceae bacterium]|nr:hypothetical protein [Saprospiraceae bacterium]
MIRAMLADADQVSAEMLQKQVGSLCPQVSLSDMAHSSEDARELVQKLNPELIFLIKV